MNRAMSSSRKVRVSLTWVPIESDHVPPACTRGHQALHDEPVRGLDEQDVLHPALVEERADRAKDLFEILARAALVDPHAQPSSSGTGGLVQQPAVLGAALAHAEDPSGRECNQRSRRQQGDDDDRRGPGRPCRSRRSTGSPGRRPMTGPSGTAPAARPRPTRSTASASPTTWRSAGSTDNGNTTPLTRNRAPAIASGYDHDSCRVWRQIAASSTPMAMIGPHAEGQDDEEQRPVHERRVERHAEPQDADADRDEPADDPDAEPGHAAAEQRRRGSRSG